MILNKGRQGSILLYVMLLINIALVVGVVVYNNSYVIINNIDVGNNQEEVFSNIYDKGNIAIDSVKKYNSNGGGYVDGLSCPTNVTMSGSYYRAENINTELIEEYGNTYCQGTYNEGPDGAKQFRIYYNEALEDFDTTTFWPNPYWTDTVSIVQSIGTNVELSTDNIAADPSTSINYSTAASGWPGSNINDENHSSQYISNNSNSINGIEIDFGRDIKVGRIIIRKQSRSSLDWQYWSNGSIDFKDNGNNIDYDKRIDLPNGMLTNSYSEYNLGYSGLAHETRYVELISYYGHLDLYEIEIYELLSTGSEEEWEGSRSFYDLDNTFMTFNTDGLHGDGIDDDLNSDNYRVTSRDNQYFPNGYQDDDVVPRKTIFGSISAQKPYQHVYWNNYKTIDIIENNSNNDDILNVKMGDINQAHVFINTFNTEDLDYDIKILEFDREIYKTQFTLLPLASYEGKNIGEYLGYLQLNSGDNSLSVSKSKTGNEFEFDFQTKDYAIFFANNSDALLSYHLEAYTDSGTGIYINPIDDSGTGTISVLANHIIIGGEKNFIGENFEVIGSK